MFLVLLVVDMLECLLPVSATLMLEARLFAFCMPLRLTPTELRLLLDLPSLLTLMLDILPLSDEPPDEFRVRPGPLASLEPRLRDLASCRL